jgi:hypothetical protein
VSSGLDRRHVDDERDPPPPLDRVAPHDAHHPHRALLALGLEEDAPQAEVLDLQPLDGGPGRPEGERGPRQCRARPPGRGREREAEQQGGEQEPGEGLDPPSLRRRAGIRRRRRSQSQKRATHGRPRYARPAPKTIGRTVREPSTRFRPSDGERRLTEV